MSSVGSSTSGYNNSFDPSGDNGGQIVDQNAYENQQATNRQISNSIMEQIGGGKSYGFNLANVVDAMVAGQMGDTIPSLQRQITNTNVRISSVAKLENLMAQLQKTTLTPLEAGLSPYSVQSSDPNGIAVSAANSNNLTQIQPFTVKTTQLAQSDTWVFATAEKSASAMITGSGSLTISLANGQSKEIKIDKNSSLDSIAKQINNAGAGVKASVVKQDNGYHLVATSNNTGKENAVTFGFKVDADSGDLSQLFAKSNNVQKAQDASYTINGVNMTSSSNNISYDGVNITLNKANATATVSTKTDTSNVAQAVNGFVSNYNELIKTINNLNSSTSGKEGQGSLYHDSDLQTVIDGLRNTVLKTLPNHESLYDLGIDLNSDGSLSLNQSKLTTALQSNPAFADKIFSTHMSATDSDIQVIGYNKTASTLSPETQSGRYDVKIKQNATKAEHTASGTLAVNQQGKVSLNEDTTLSMSVTGEANPGQFDGEKKTTDIKITIPKGNYTPDELAEKIQSQINGNSAVKESHGEMTVSVKEGHLVFTSQNYGSLNGFNFNSKNSSNVSALGIEAGDMDKKKGYVGKDTIGTINGQYCISDGQYIKAQSDKVAGGAAAGLTIKVTGGSLGDRGMVTLSRGYADNLNGLLGSYTRFSDLDPEKSGVLAKKEYDYQQDVSDTNLSSLVSQLKEAQARKSQLTEQYFEQYKNVNSMLAQMNSEQEYIKNMLSPNSNSDHNN